MNDEKLRPPQDTGTPLPEPEATMIPAEVPAARPEPGAPMTPAEAPAARPEPGPRPPTPREPDVAGEPAPHSSPQPAGAAPAPALPALQMSMTGLISEYERTVKWNSLIRVVFPVFVLAVIVVFMLVTVLGVMSAFPEKRVTAETVKAGEEILPVLNKVLRTFVDEVAPQLAEEFQKGLEKGSEKLAESLSLEIERMEKKTQEYVKTKVHDTIAAARKDHRKMLLAAMPELKDDPARLERLTERVNRAFELWTVAYMLRILEDYYLAMAKINDTVIKGFQPDPKAVTSHGAQEAEMLELFMELLNAAYEQDLVGGLEQPNPAAPPADRAAPPADRAAPPADEAAPPADEAAPPADEAAPASTNPTNP